LLTNISNIIIEFKKIFKEDIFMGDSKKYISLEFTHTEINELLKKINAGMVLTKEQ
jgi:hypothetical protein